MQNFQRLAPKSRVAESYGRCISILLRNCHTNFYSAGTSRQTWETTTGDTLCNRNTYILIFFKKEFKWVFPITDDNTFIRLHKPANKNPTAKNGLLLLQSYRFQMLQTLGLGYTPKRDVRPSCWTQHIFEWQSMGKSSWYWIGGLIPTLQLLKWWKVLSYLQSYPAVNPWEPQ